MLTKKNENTYTLEGQDYDITNLLSAVMEVDDLSKEKMCLSEETATKLDELFSLYSSVPSFKGLLFMSGSASLFEYLASSGDEELLNVVAKNMGYLTEEERFALLKSSGAQSSAYREWWLKYAEGVLTREGFEAFRFGSVKMDRNGCYLYDNEKAVLYAEVSREGGEKRDFLLSLTLLGNPEAIEDEEKNREFEWCCYFDDLLGQEDPRVLGGQLRALDPYGEKSRLLRRYDIVYSQLLPSEAALVTVELVKLLELYPPEN